MTFLKIRLPSRTMLLMLALVTSCGSVWASSTNCAYPLSGTGMGGTGDVARGTGIGGTGAPEAATGAMRLAGKVTFSQGVVEAQRDGNTRRIAQGDAVCGGETIVTSQSGTVQMRMVDQAMIAVRPMTQLKIETYIYRGNSKDRSQLALLRGTSHFVTGKIGKAYPQNDLIRTPTATIGVRGTDHEATVILPNENAGFPSGTYDKVNSGITFIRTEKGEVEIHPNEVGFAADFGEQPTILKDMPGFYQANPSVSPEGRASKDEAGKEEAKDDSGERRTEDSADRSGEGTTSGDPEGTGTPPRERPDAHNRDRPESHALPDLPQAPERPEMPEVAEHHDSPEHTGNH